MGEVTVVACGKGGIGKTMLSFGLSAMLADMNHSVVLVDLCCGLRQSDMLLGVESQIVYDWNDVAGAVCTLNQALVHTGKKGLSLLSAPPYLLKCEGSVDIGPLLSSLSEQYEHVIVDTPSGVFHGYDFFPPIEAKWLLVTSPDDAAMRDADRTRMLLEERGHRPSFLVINRVVPKWVHENIQYQPTVVEQTLDLRLLGVIPEDERFAECLLQRRWLHAPSMRRYSPAAEAIAHIACRLLGEERLPSQWQVQVPSWGKKSMLYRQIIKEVWL